MKYITTIYLLIILCFVASHTEAGTTRIVLIETMPVPVVVDHSKAIQDAFRALEKKGVFSFELDVLKAEGNKQKAMKLLQESMAKKPPDLVITIATLAAQAAKEVLQGTKIPLLFCLVADPIGSGIVSKIGVPSGDNISGILYSQLRDAKLEIAMRLLAQNSKGSVTKVGIIQSDYPSVVGEIRELREIAASGKNVTFTHYSFPYKPVPSGLPVMYDNLKNGIEEARGNVDFLWEVPGPLSELMTFSQILNDSGIPVLMGNTSKSVELGALMAVPTNCHETGNQVVEMAAKVLQGTDIGTLPVTIPKKFDLYLNLKTADKLGIRVPSHLLMIAGDNIIR